MRSWLATVLVVALVSGCAARVPPPMAAPPDVPATAPDGTPLRGTYDEGIADGAAAATERRVIGWYVGGFAAAPFALAACAVILVGAAIVGGAGGNCGGGNCNGPDKPAPDPVKPDDAEYRTPRYLEGYDRGYVAELDDRQGAAFAGGFWTFVGLAAIGALVYYESLEPDEQRELRGKLSGARDGRPRSRGLSVEF